MINSIPPGISKQLDLPFRLALAVAPGFALALLVEYLDPTVRNREELASYGLPKDVVDVDEAYQLLKRKIEEAKQ